MMHSIAFSSTKIHFNIWRLVLLEFWLYLIRISCHKKRWKVAVSLGYCSLTRGTIDWHEWYPKFQNNGFQFREDAIKDKATCVMRPGNISPHLNLMWCIISISSTYSLIISCCIWNDITAWGLLIAYSPILNILTA